jgi:hypothetical protein
MTTGVTDDPASAHPPVLQRGRRGIGERGWLRVTLACAVALVVIDVWWLVAYRRGFPVDVDEAGYMTIALNDHAALAHGGLTSYWHAVQSASGPRERAPALTNQSVTTTPARARSRTS